MNGAYKISVLLALVAIACVICGGVMENWLLLLGFVLGFIAVWFDELGWRIEVREFHRK